MPARSRKLDHQLLADPAIRAAIEARQMSLWQETVTTQQSRRPVVEATLPWGSAFRIAVDTATHARHASHDRARTECDISCAHLVVADGAVGPNGTWRKPDCPPCLQIVEAWEAAHA